MRRHDYVAGGFESAYDDEGRNWPRRVFLCRRCGYVLRVYVMVDTTGLLRERSCGSALTGGAELVRDDLAPPGALGILLAFGILALLVFFAAVVL